jgi:hypothetical protein
MMTDLVKKMKKIAAVVARVGYPLIDSSNK